MSWPERAMQIWMVLVGLAHNRQLITYDQLRHLIGFGGPAHYLATPLGYVMYYCQQQSLPALTVLVVANNGRPGPGLIGVQDVDQERERVFNHPWYSLRPVQQQDLTAAWTAANQPPAPPPPD